MTAKRALVRIVKPRVSPASWQRMRSLAASLSHAAASRRVESQLRNMNLSELAVHFKTDKCGIHKYTQHYQRHLQQWRHERFVLLEIGIGGYSRAGRGGASLRMWKHYFPKAQIVGLDIEDKSFVIEDRIQAYRGSQVDEAILHRIVDEAGPIRVIVDDGSHRPEHIRRTFALLFPLLEQGGTYIIEDTQTSYWPDWGGSDDRHDPNTTMGLIKDLVDGLNYEEFDDETYVPTYTDRNIVAIHAYHNLAIIEKGANAEGTLRRRTR
jgi:hypothetical protein